MQHNLTILQNALANHLLGILRNKNSRIEQFRAALDKLSYILLAETMRDFPLKVCEVETPLEKTQVSCLAYPVVLVPILRAGLSMLSPFMHCLPDAQIGFIGQKRDEETAEAFEYYKNFPDLKGKKIIIIDPMLATGGSAVATIASVIEKGSREEDIQLVCVIAAPEGVKYVQQHYAKVHILTASLDRELNDKKYILPGLGDAGDLWTGVG